MRLLGRERFRPRQRLAVPLARLARQASAERRWRDRAISQPGSTRRQARQLTANGTRQRLFRDSTALQPDRSGDQQELEAGRYREGPLSGKMAWFTQAIKSVSRWGAGSKDLVATMKTEN